MRAEMLQNSALPLLLIDVDGVISLWGWPPERRPEGTWTLVDGIGHFISAEAGRALSRLAEDFALVWCTGWEEKADQYLPSLIGVGPLPHLSFDRRMGGARSLGHWKLEAIDAYAGPDRPVAWVDDAFTPPCRAWAAARPGPTLLVETTPASGMTAGHADALRSWAAAL